MSIVQIAISTALHESQTLAYNYASLALNNSFFFHPLMSLWPHPCRISRVKTYLTAAVTGMLTSSSFVWLVTDALQVILTR